MATYTVRKGRRYRATIALGLLQSVASNDMIADRFREAGFADVEVHRCVPASIVSVGRRVSP